MKWQYIYSSGINGTDNKMRSVSGGQRGKLNERAGKTHFPDCLNGGNGPIEIDVRPKTVANSRRGALINSFRPAAKVVLGFAAVFLTVSDNLFGQPSAVNPAVGTTVNTTIRMAVQPKETFIGSVLAEEGLFGQEVASSIRGRLMMLPSWKEGTLIHMFSEAARNNNKTNDWYGEHAGKWMMTASMAVGRTGNAELRRLLYKTADYLVGTQEKDGYLGSYSKALRITNKAATTHQKSWDVWSLTYMTLGLLDVYRESTDPKYLNAADKIGGLFLKTFGPGKENVTDYGTREGISATIMLEATVELYKATGNKDYVTLARKIVQEMEARKGVQFISAGVNKVDLEKVGDGKAYQIIWNLLALTKYYQVTGDKDVLTAVLNDWQNIVDYHLTITGGPWGGIGKHLECFNVKNFWSPYGFIETCSIMSWIQLNKALLALTGEHKYAEQIENAAYNALLGAKYADGVRWSYHSFVNGCRHEAHFNDCCPSSGALALEEVAGAVYGLRDGGVVCNLYTAGQVALKIKNDRGVQILQQTDYPFNGRIQMVIQSKQGANFPLYLRIPTWCKSPVVRLSVNGSMVDINSAVSDGYMKIERDWGRNDVLHIDFPMEPVWFKRVERAKVPQGNNDIYKVDWVALKVGPLVYAEGGLLDGKNRENNLDTPFEKIIKGVSKTGKINGIRGDGYQLAVPDKGSLQLVPFYEAGRRALGTWHFTWLQNYVGNGAHK